MAVIDKDSNPKGGQSMTIGEMHLGCVRKHGQQNIQTKFIVIGLPLMPTTSTLFTDVERGVDIPLFLPSVIAAYLRFYSFIAIIAAFIFLGGGNSPSDRMIQYVVTTFVCVLWLYFLVGYGRLSRHGRVKASLLQAGCGLSLEPELLRAETRQSIYTHLLQTMKSHGVPHDPAYWLSNSPSREVVAIVYALSCYGQFKQANRDSWRQVQQRILPNTASALQL